MAHYTETSDRPRSGKGRRFKKYDSTFTSAGRTVQNVWMDQYGQIFEFKLWPHINSNGKRSGTNAAWMPTGECGVATH